MVGSNVFGKFLMGTTIQNSSKREKSIIVTSCHASLAKSVKLK